MKKLNVLGVCAGNGVCLYPFLEKFNIIGNYEPRGVFYDKNQEQWEANFPGIPQYRKEIKHKKPIDIIIGHPDCGDSSVLRMSRAKKAGNVNDNVSIMVFLNSITSLKPKFFLLENLPGFLKGYGEEVLRGYLFDYNLIIHEASVSNWGNSQLTRKRLVIVGIREDLPKETKRFFKLPKLKKDKLKFSQEFELGLNQQDSIAHVREDLLKKCNLYWGNERQITYLKAEQIWNDEFKDQGRWHVGGKMNNQPGVSRNMRDEYPLTVRKQNRQFGTQGLVLSPREMANIQGVPNSFHLVYKKEQSIYWINKGRLTVTKTMPFEIGKWFATKILKFKKQH